MGQISKKRKKDRERERERKKIEREGDNQVEKDTCTDIKIHTQSTCRKERVVHGSLYKKSF
jgi:hypothetical protein